MDVQQNTLYLLTPGSYVGRDHLTRAQKSVFECHVGDKEWAILKDRLMSVMKPEEDSLRFYFLDETAIRKIEHHGCAEPVNLTEPLLL